MVDIRDPAALAQNVATCDVQTFRTVFTEIVEIYRGPVYALAYRMLGDAHEADDVAQETFVSVFENLRKFRGEAQVYTWLYRIALRAAQRHLQEKSRGGASDPAAAAPRAGDAASPERRAIGAELATALDRAMAELPIDQRTCLALFSLDGLSCKEIAEILGTKEGTVWSRLHYARAKLAQALAAYL